MDGAKEAEVSSEDTIVAVILAAVQMGHSMHQAGLGIALAMNHKEEEYVRCFLCTCSQTQSTTAVVAMFEVVTCGALSIARFPRRKFQHSDHVLRCLFGLDDDMFRRYMHVSKGLFSYLEDQVECAAAHEFVMMLCVVQRTGGCEFVDTNKACKREDANAQEGWSASSFGSFPLLDGTWNFPGGGWGAVWVTQINSS